MTTVGYRNDRLIKQMASHRTSLTQIILQVLGTTHSTCTSLQMSYHPSFFASYSFEHCWMARMLFVVGGNYLLVSLFFFTYTETLASEILRGTASESKTVS
mmetsp:Transcript_14449/g.31743  ORF Transcript_14449/g.31743 Transcript_14449/m.31743 type:complete len:101 (+) Transcript_14449:2288-2590(+)